MGVGVDMGMDMGIDMDMVMKMKLILWQFFAPKGFTAVPFAIRYGRNCASTTMLP